MKILREIPHISTIQPLKVDVLMALAHCAGGSVQTWSHISPHEYSKYKIDRKAAQIQHMLLLVKNISFYLRMPFSIAWDRFIISLYTYFLSFFKITWLLIINTKTLQLVVNHQGGNFYWCQDAIIVAIRTHASVHDLQQSPGEVWGNFGGDGVTPWKMNGWNLQPSPIFRKKNDLNQTSMMTCSS